MLPAEVLDFLRVPGRALTIKGQAGTGKTLLSLALAERYQREAGDVLWATSRYTDPRTAEGLERRVEESHRFDFLAEHDHDTPGSPAVDLDPAAFIEDLGTAMDASRRPLVILDSIDGLTEGLDPAEQQQLLARLIGLARATGSLVVLIIESEAEHPADYQSDGVLRLTAREHHGTRLRQLHLDKLRGVSLDRATVPFSLARGTFSALTGASFTDTTGLTLPPAQSAPDGHISTGTHGWDLLLDGGFPLGSAHYIEVDAGASSPQSILAAPLALDAQAHRRGLVGIQPPNHPSRAFRRLLTPDEAGADGWATLLDAGELAAGRTQGAAGGSLWDALAPLEIAREAYRERGPVTSVLHLDAVTAAYGPADTLAWLSAWVHDTHTHGDVDLLVATAPQGLSIPSLVESHWRIEAIGGTAFLRGVVPTTAMHALRGESGRGYLEARLDPMR